MQQPPSGPSHPNLSGQPYQEYPPNSAPPAPPYSPNPAQPGSSYPPYSGGPNPGFPPASPAPQSTQGIALKYGLIFGAVMVAFQLLSAYVVSRLVVSFEISLRVSYSAMSIYSLVQSAIFMLIYWALYFVMGMLVARRTGKVLTSILAGVWAGLLLFIVYCVIVVINVASVFGYLRQGALTPAYLVALLMGFVTVLFLDVGAGIGIAALGGLVGKGTERKAPPMIPLQ